MACTGDALDLVQVLLCSIFAVNSTSCHIDVRLAETEASSASCVSGITTR